MTAIVLPPALLRETIDILRRGGLRQEERVALWLSTAAQRSPAPIVEVYEPAQIAAIDYFRLPPDSMRALMYHLRSTRRRIVAQIHTHPGRAFHSEVDAEWAIVRHVGALSLVLPRFAATTTAETFLDEVMTYAYTPEGEWRHHPNFGPEAQIRMS
jgi:proteasome lid subunit RPN8/RPN11